MSGSVSRGKDSPSQSVQMIGRPLMTPDELKSIPKGHFVVMKTGTHPMQTQLRLFLDWGIRFGKAYELPEKAARPVSYANKKILIQASLNGILSFRCAPPHPPKVAVECGNKSRQRLNTKATGAVHIEGLIIYPSRRMVNELLQLYLRRR